MKFKSAFILAAWVLAIPSLAMAQQVQMVIPNLPGGAMDVTGRAMADALGGRLKETVVPLNKPGAGTMLGTEWVAAQKPSRTTTLLLAGPAFNSQQFSPTRPFDPKKLLPVAMIGVQPHILFIRSSIPVTTVAEFVAWAKKQPNGVTFATSGPGSGPHLGAAQFANFADIKPVFVPTAGQATSVPLVAAGEVDAVFSGPSNRPLVMAQKLRALFVGADKPLAEWPEIPTSDQVGLSGLRLGTWYGVFMATHAPPADIEKFNRLVNEALNDPETSSRLQKVGVVPKAVGAPANFVKFLAEEHKEMQVLIQKKLLTIE